MEQMVREKQGNWYSVGIRGTGHEFALETCFIARVYVCIYIYIGRV